MSLIMMIIFMCENSVSTENINVCINQVDKCVIKEVVNEKKELSISFDKCFCNAGVEDACMVMKNEIEEYPEW